MNHKFVFVFAVMMATLPMTLGAQGKKKSSAKEISSMNVTGCFNKGADADHYVLKDEKGKQYVVTGDAAKLSAHANNHNVTITGTMGKEKGKNVLKATDLKMNSICK